MPRTTSIKAAPPATMDEFHQRYGATAVTWKALTSVLDTTQSEVVQVLKAQQATIAALEQRITALEARPHVKFCGPWDSAKCYTAGDAVVFQGGLWVCRIAETTGRPNQAFHAWTLAVKSRSIA